MNTTNEELPALIKGNGTPVGGMEDVTTSTLIRNCMPMSAVIPVAISMPNSFGALAATSIPRHINIQKAAISSIKPIKPNSSPMMDNIKSDSA